MSQYSIFKPKSARGMFVDYPELKKLKAFALLRPQDMLFVWYLSCESSPVNNGKKQPDKRIRIQQAIDYSYFAEGQKLISQIEADKLLDGRFTEKISAAMEQMERFKVGPRIRAKQMTEKAFDNLEKIIGADASTETDLSKQKAYVDIVEKGIKIMPAIIESLEGGYRLVEEEDKDEESLSDGMSAIDKYHSEIDSE
jgi:hypothetical protein